MAVFRCEIRRCHLMEAAPRTVPISGAPSHARLVREPGGKLDRTWRKGWAALWCRTYYWRRSWTESGCAAPPLHTHTHHSACTVPKSYFVPPVDSSCLPGGSQYAHIVSSTLSVLIRSPTTTLLCVSRCPICRHYIHGDLGARHSWGSTHLADSLGEVKSAGSPQSTRRGGAQRSRALPVPPSVTQHWGSG